jgi:hypothetical protein
MYLQTGQGKEFENKQVRAFLQQQGGIKQFSVKSQFKAAIVERWNRTIKTKMYRYFTHVGSHRWIEVLPKLIKAYNASIHRSIGMTPKDVNRRNEFALWQSQQKEMKKGKTTQLKVGNYVRVSKANQMFSKGYETQWSEEVFTIAKVIKRPASPVTYKLQDYEGTLIDGVFYREEIQRVSKPEVYRVEKVLRTRRLSNGQVSRLVKWVGYKQPTWTTSDIVRI